MSFLHAFNPQPILFQFGFIKIHWYGLLMMIAIFVGIFLVAALAKKYGIKKDDVYDLAFYLVIFGLAGARIYAVLLFPSHYFSNPLEIIQVWKGGLAIHGAILGGFFALLWHCKKKKQPFWLWADLIVVALALGQAIGRWGNYFNQELYGTPTTLPWGIPISPEFRAGAFRFFEYFHPTFLYESVLNFIVFIILLSLHYWRMKNSTFAKASADKQESEIKELEPGTHNLKPHYGNIALLYLIFYSLIRIAMEQLRVDETPLAFGIRLPIVMSLVLLAGAGYVLMRKKKAFIR